MAMTKTTSVYLVDDHEMILPGIRMSVEAHRGFAVVGMATDGQTAYEGIRELRPDIAVLDLSIPLLSGFELVAKFRQEGCRTRFIILTSYSDDKYIKEALALKVEGYILKENPSTELIAALDAVFGAARALLDGVFDDRVFVISFLSNVVVAAFLVFLGDQLGVGAQISTGVVVVLAMRIFANVAAIRRRLLKA